MKISILAGLAFLCAARTLLAQTATPPAVSANPGPVMDPAKVAEYQKRFQEGFAMEKAGQLSQARSIFDGILAEQPDAKRSLLEAGRVSLELNEPLKADAYLDKLHAIVPQFPEAIELLIQADESLKKEVKADRLVREYRTLRDSGTVPGFGDSLFFKRERVRLDGGAEIVISQYFDYTKPPFCSLKAELFQAQNPRPQRVLWLKYDPDGTAEVRAKDPKLVRDEVFILAEPFYTGDRVTKINVYRELLSAPDYAKARSILLVLFASTPKPIYTAPVTDVGPAAK